MPSKDHAQSNGGFRHVKNLGDIPSDWDVALLSSLTSLVTSGSRGWSKYMTSEGAFFVRSQNIGLGTLRWDDVAFVHPPNDQEASRAQIELNDLLISVTGEPGNVALANESVRHGFVSQHVALVRLKDESLASWAVTALSSAIGQSQFQSKLYGQTRPGLNLDNIGELLIPLPSEAERSLIRRTLEAVHDAIEQTRAVIDQTRKLKTALLQDLLTNGLPGRHSTFSTHRLAGRIPSDWTVQPLDDIAKVVDCKHRTPKYQEAGFPVVRPGDVKEGKLDLSESPRTCEAEFEDLVENYRPVRGDIVYSRNASFGVAAYADTDEPYTIGQDVVIITSDEVSNQYLYFLLNSQSFKRQLYRLSAGSTFQRINLDDIRRYSIAVPDNDEQERIAHILWQLDKRTEAEKSRLEQLHRTKSALSQELLTGRVRVPTKGGE